MWGAHMGFKWVIYGIFIVTLKLAFFELSINPSHVECLQIYKSNLYFKRNNFYFILNIKL